MKKMDERVRASRTFKWVMVLSSISLLLNWGLLAEKMPESVRAAFYCVAIVANAVFALKDKTVPDVYQQICLEVQRSSKATEADVAKVVWAASVLLWCPAGLFHEVVVWPVIFLSVATIVLQTFLMVVALSFWRSKAAE